MSWWDVLQACAAGALVVVGMTVLAAGGLLSGVLFLAGGVLWLARALRP